MSNWELRDHRSYWRVFLFTDFAHFTQCWAFNINIPRSDNRLREQVSLLFRHEDIP